MYSQGKASWMNLQAIKKTSSELMDSPGWIENI